MSDTTPARKARTPKNRIIRVEDHTTRGVWYYAPSLTSAKARHVEGITAREATPEEIMEIGRAGYGVVGLTNDHDGSDADAPDAPDADQQQLGGLDGAGGEPPQQ